MELPHPSSPPTTTAAPPTSTVHPMIPATITTANVSFMACDAQSACSMQTCDAQILDSHISDSSTHHIDHQLMQCIPVNVAEQVTKETSLAPSMQEEDHASTVRNGDIPLAAQRTFDDHCHGSFIKYDEINHEEEEEEGCTTPTRAQYCTCDTAHGYDCGIRDVYDNEERVVDADLGVPLAVHAYSMLADINEERGFLDIKRKGVEAKKKSSKWASTYRSSRCRCPRSSSDQPPPAPRKPKAKPRMIKSCSHLNFFIPAPADLELFFTSSATPDHHQLHKITPP